MANEMKSQSEVPLRHYSHAGKACDASEEMRDNKAGDMLMKFQMYRRGLWWVCIREKYMRRAG